MCVTKHTAPLRLSSSWGPSQSTQLCPESSRIPGWRSDLVGLLLAARVGRCEIPAFHGAAMTQAKELGQGEGNLTGVEVLPRLLPSCSRETAALRMPTLRSQPVDCISVILWSPAAGVAAQDRQPQIGVLEKEGQGASRTLWTLWRLSSKLCSLLSRPDTGMGEAQNLNDFS